MDYKAQKEHDDHKDIIKTMVELQKSQSAMMTAQTQILKSIEGMRGDMNKLLTETKQESYNREKEIRDEVKELREKIVDAIGDSHERMTSIENIARAADQRSEGTSKGLWVIATGVVFSLVSSIMAFLSGGGG